MNGPLPPQGELPQIRITALPDGSADIKFKGEIPILMAVDILQKAASAVLAEYLKRSQQKAPPDILPVTVLPRGMDNGGD